jgi:two-component system response regulator HydG
VLQDGAFERVGGVKTLRVDVRLVCATNKNLIEEVRAGRFREDLYYRINVIYLRVPALRERRADIAPLAEDFLRHFSRVNGKKISGFEPKALEALTDYPWPGNVRELKNIVERMVVLSRGSGLTLADVPEDIQRPMLGTPSLQAAAPVGQLSEIEKSAILAKLQAVRGNKSLAAKELGISRRTLYRKIQEYGLN